MNAAVDPNIYTDNRGLSQLRAAARSGENKEETLRKVAGQFESIFVNMVLKTMREASLGDGIMDSDQTKFYQSMFDQQIAQEMTRGRGLGLAELLVRQLSPESGAKGHTDKTRDGSMPLTGQDKLHYAVQRPTQKSSQTREVVAPVAPVMLDKATGGNWQPDSPAEFVGDLWPHAQQAAKELGTQPEVLLAQAALESGWGKHQMRLADGRSAHNLFGIKADKGWQGQRVSQQTLEFRSGLMQKERAAFRAYDNPAASFQDYVAFIKDNPRYREALHASQQGRDYIQEIHRAGYATDPQYQSKINKIMNSSQFREALAEFKSAPRQPLVSVQESTARERLVHNQTAASSRSGEV